MWVGYGPTSHIGPKVVPAPHQVCLTHPTSFSCTHSTSELTRWPISRSRDYVFALPPMKHGFGMPFRCPPGAPAGPTIRIGAIHLFFCTHVCCGSMNRPCFDVEGSDSSMHRSQEENERDWGQIWAYVIMVSHPYNALRVSLPFQVDRITS